METGLLSSLGVCSEPGTAGDHGWGGGPQGPVQVMAAQTPQSENPASWPTSEWAGEQEGRHCDSTQPALSPRISLLLPSP